MASVLPRAVLELSQELTAWPGIGPKTARRLAIYLLRQPRRVVGTVADTLKNLHANVRICQTCFNLSETDQCVICRDSRRRQEVVCVVENPLDVEAIEQAGSYDGVYHVLGGVLSPLEGIDAEHLTLNELFHRVQQRAVAELIIALNMTLESEATARYIIKQLAGSGVRVSRLGR